MDKTRLMREALAIMGRSGNAISWHWFRAVAIDWLAEQLMDLHLEFHEHEGWSVGCCYEESTWSDWLSHDNLEIALCKAIFHLRDRKDLEDLCEALKEPGRQSYEEFRGELGLGDGS